MTNRQHPTGFVDVTGHFDAHENLRIQLQNYTEHTVPALHIDAYAQEVYQANKDALGVRHPMGAITPMSADPISAEMVTDLLLRARLNPGQWDLSEIARKANAWITDNLNELSHIGASWPSEDRTAHLTEFGNLTAIDFIEQCVIEAGPDTAPWQDLQHRADAGEFDDWPPIWTADLPPTDRCKQRHHR